MSHGSLADNPRAVAVADALSRWLDDSSVQRVARISGIGRSTLYDWMDLKHAVPAWALAPIYTASPSVSSLDLCVGIADLGLDLTPSPTTKGASPTLAEEALRVGKTSGDIQGSIVAAIADGNVSEAEQVSIRRAIDAHKAEIARLESLLNSRELRVAGMR